MPFIKIYDEEHKETELKKEIDFFKNGKIEDNYIIYFLFRNLYLFERNSYRCISDMPYQFFYYTCML